jgi:hypothetical protein
MTKLSIHVIFITVIIDLLPFHTFPLNIKIKKCNSLPNGPNSSFISHQIHQIKQNQTAHSNLS